MENRTIARPNLARQNENMSVVATCPLCNAVITWPQPGEGGEDRVVCPRCQEWVTPLPLDNNRNVAPDAIPAVEVPSSESRRQKNLRLAGFILGGMALLAFVVTIWLVNTRDRRRLTQLAESPGLGYVPSHANVIIGVNLVEAERSKVGLGIDTLDRVGFRTGGSWDLERLVGLGREQIAVLLISLRVDQNLLPRWCIIVETRSPLNPDAVRSRLTARAARDEGDRSHYLATPPALGIEAALWFPDARTMVLAYPPTELAEVPRQADSNPQRFAAPIHDLLMTRSERDSFLWLVAHAEDWNKTSLPISLQLVPGLAPLRPLLSSLRTVGLAFREDKGEIVTRARPARITAPPSDTPPAVALDLVMITPPEADLPNLIDGLETWSDRQRLLIRDQNREGLRFSATLVGTPSDWETVLESLRRQK
jgi:hypothetical protein